MKDIYAKLALIISLIVLALFTLNFLLGGNNIRKTGVVEMEKLVYDYKGMKDASAKYTAKMNQWSAQSDSIKKKLEGYLYDIKMDSINGDKKKLLSDQQKFILLRKSYYEFEEAIKQKAQEEDQQMTIGVINQLKEHIKEYAKEEGYDLILLNTQMQNVGYVEEAGDLTEEILEFSNKKYEGEK